MEMGASLNHLDRDQYSLLRNLIGRFHPIDAQAIVEDWIRFFKTCGNDVALYLTNEVELTRYARIKDKDMLGGGRSVRLALDQHGDPQVQIAWYVDPQGAAAQVLQEFCDLGDDPCCCHLKPRADPRSDPKPCLCSWPLPSCANRLYKAV